VSRGARAAIALASAVLAWTPCARAQRGRPAPPPPAPEENGPQQVHHQETREMTIAVGENRTIPATDVRNYSEGTPGIVDVKVTSDTSQFVVVGLKPGSTSLLLLRKDGSQINWIINVFSRSPQLVEKEVTELLQGYTGIRLRRVGARFFIEGGVNTEADLQRIKQIAALYPGQVESLVALGSGGMAHTANVRLDVFFVQYKKSSSYNVGIDLPGEIGGAAVSQTTFGYDFVANTVTAQAAIVNQALPGLDIASQHGWAKVLKQTTVITTNGVEASFSNGGEQNFPVSAGLTGTIQKISYGTIVTVLPRFDPDTGDLEVKVDADISDLTAPVANTPLPGRDTAKLQTIVHMKLGQSLVLSGIRTRSQTHSVTGLPILSEIPVIGLFFGAHQDQRDDREGAIFLVPSIVEASARPPYDMIRDAMTQYSDYDGDIHKVKSFEPMPPGAPAPARPPGR
jgi:pilus assembly protein CpaC